MALSRQPHPYSPRMLMRAEATRLMHTNARLPHPHLHPPHNRSICSTSISALPLPIQLLQRSRPSGLHWCRSRFRHPSTPHLTSHAHTHTHTHTRTRTHILHTYTLKHTHTHTHTHHPVCMHSNSQLPTHTHTPHASPRTQPPAQPCVLVDFPPFVTITELWLQVAEASSAQRAVGRTHSHALRALRSAVRVSSQH